MIPDRIIEQGTLEARDGRVFVEVRLPWYRALPGSCIAAASLTVDGVEAAPETLRWRMNGTEFTFEQLATNTEQWWFPTDSVVLSGDLEIAPAEEHEVEVGLTLYIPYIVISDSEVLHIEERDRKTMTLEAVTS